MFETTGCDGLVAIVQIDFVVLEALQQGAGHAGVIDDLCHLDGLLPLELEPALLSCTDRPVLILGEFGRDDPAVGHFCAIVVAEDAAGGDLCLGGHVDGHLLGLRRATKADD